MKINSSSIIDSLVYGYATNSNQLLYVTDKANDTTAHLGDFTEINNNTSQDYWYDGNGNFTKDNNKGISAITYNFLNLPETITVTGKGTISYTYDATGMKLQKKITEGSRIVTTTYIGGFVYKNDTLQYILNEEGRIRPSTKGLPSLVYDYFVKDHLGNIRMVLTEEKDTSIYPMSTFEDADLATDTLYYDNANSQRTGRPGSFYTSSSNGTWVQLLRKNVQSVGAGKILKVMSGDKLDIKVDYYIPTATTDNSAANGLNSIITSLTTLINTDPVTTSLHGSGGTITTALNSSTPFTSFLAPQNGTAGTTLPKAYLNIVFFDEQFKFVSQNSEAVQVTTEGSGQTIYRLGGTAKTATKNGFVYIYVSNESNNLVYFDNLQITHEHGPLVQEDHYYPYGQGMAGISSSAISGIVANAYKANGSTELGSGEWADGKGLELYETTYRSFDAQIGRFMQIDPLMESSANFSGYAFVIDNPSYYTDPLGLREKHQQEGPVNNADYSIFWDGVIDQYLTTGKVTWPPSEDDDGGGGGGDDAYPTDADYKTLDEVKVKGNDNSWKKTLQDLLDNDGPKPKPRNPFRFTLGFTGSSSAFDGGIRFKIFGIGASGTVQRHERMLLGFNDNEFVLMQNKFTTGSSLDIGGFGKGVKATSDQSDYLNPSSYTLETDMPFTKIENEVNSKSQKIENSVTSIQFWDIKVGWFGGFETSFKIEIPNGQRPFTGQPTHTDASFVSHSVIIKSIH